MFKLLKLYYVLISLPFVMLLVGSAIFYSAIMLTITRNPHPQINFTIFAIILIGGVLILLNARRLVGEARTVVDFSQAIRAKLDWPALQERTNHYTGAVSYLFQMVAASGGRSISHQEQVAIEHELSNARSGLVRRNALPQYLTGLLVGMGLLGTFIGLLATLNDISTLISSFAEIDMQNANPLVVFRTMIERMKAPMQSMGIAFSASMFGLLGSIILGLMMVGIRRLQGDIFSLLSSEIARHIEIALSYEGVALEGGPAAAVMGGNEYKVLVRIEERLAEAARLQQRRLTSELDDFQKQRAEMLRTLTEQTEASHSFRSELQQLGRQLGGLVNIMESSHGDINTQLSELTVNMSGDAKETRKLLAMQVDEQKELKDALDSQNIGDKLTELVNSQQQTFSVEMGDLHKQRDEILQLLAEQTEASRNVPTLLQQLGGQIGTLVGALEKGDEKTSEQIASLTEHLVGDANEASKLLAMQVHEQRSLKEALDSYNIEERLTEATRLQQRTLSSEVDDFQKQRADMLRTLNEQTEASNHFRTELQQLGRQLADVASVMEKGNGEICSQISELMIHMTADAKESQKLLAMLVNEKEDENHSG